MAESTVNNCQYNNVTTKVQFKGFVLCMVCQANYGF